MDVYTILNTIREEMTPAVLATIISVEGHSYRKAGASMLFRLEDEPIGSISPGCLEADLKERIAAVWTSGMWQRVDYNMNAEEDAIWGEAVGCGGKITVLLEAVRGPLQQALSDVGDKLAAGGAVVLTRKFQDDHIIYALLDHAKSTPSQPGSTLFRPQERVVLFGAGEDSRPISNLLCRAGFHVIVADWRSGLLQEPRFPGASLIAGAPDEIVAALQINKQDYVVITSHQLMQDRAMLNAILPRIPAYVGIMGSRRRIEMLFDGIDIPPGSRIHAPVGVDIGAEGPEEIAISIAAELIAVRSGRSTGFQYDGGDSDESSGALFGSRREQENGRTQTVARIIARHHAG